MNHLNRVLMQSASIEAVKGFREGKGPRPDRSYRNARRNLARALRASIPGLTWPHAWDAAQKATYQSLRQAPKDVDANKVVRALEVDNGKVTSIGLAAKDDAEAKPEQAEIAAFEAKSKEMAVAGRAEFEKAKIAAAESADPDKTIAEPAKPKAGALSDADLQAAVNLRADHPTTSAAAKAAGLSRNAFENRLKRAAEKGIEAEPASPPPPKPPAEAPVAAPEKPKRPRKATPKAVPAEPAPEPKRVVLK